MKLFLTSSPCNDDVPVGVNLPCIFDERNFFVDNLRRCVKPQAHLTVIAADPYAYAMNSEMTDTFAKCFEYHGMGLSCVSLLDDRTRRHAGRMIHRSDVIILGGGHVPTENAFFQSIRLRERLQGYEGVVMGISAGSMNCASTVYAQPEMPGEAIDPCYERFIPGLGLTDINVLPHYQKVKDYIIDGLRLYEDVTFADSHGNCFLAMPDGSYVLREEGRETLFGEGYLIHDGVMEQICHPGGCVEL